VEQAKAPVMELRRPLNCEVIETVFGLPSFTSRLASMPKSMSPTKFQKGLLRPTVSSELKRQAVLLAENRFLLCSMSGTFKLDQDFFAENPSTTDSVPSYFSETIDPCSFGTPPCLHTKKSGRSCEAIVEDDAKWACKFSADLQPAAKGPR
jgi:hypothetical protein